MIGSFNELDGVLTQEQEVKLLEKRSGKKVKVKLISPEEAARMQE